MSGQYMTAHQVKRYMEMQQEIRTLLKEGERLRGLLREVADDYTDADGITYEIYCEFGGEEE